MMPRVEPGSVDTRRWTLIAVCVTTFMLLLDITIVNVALPSIQRRLNADLTGLQWVVDAYALALAALILTAGALADRFGRRLLFMFGVVVFRALLCCAGSPGTSRRSTSRGACRGSAARRSSRPRSR